MPQCGCPGCWGHPAGGWQGRTAAGGPAKTKLVCPACGSDRVVECGEKSRLDGKTPHTCEACNLLTGPLRPPAALWTAIVFAVLVGVGAFGLVLFEDGVPPGSFLYLIPAVCAAVAGVAINEFRKPVPKLVRR